jgi:RNA polymerase primary sigma factor
MMIATAAPDRDRLDPAPVPVRRGYELSRDEEYELAACVAAGDRGARDRLVQANLGLVVAIARRFLGRGLHLDDLVGEGNLGLIRAAEGFDPRNGARFSTYAVSLIRRAICDALIRTTSTIRVPVNVMDLLKTWGRAERALGGELDRMPRFDEIATSLGLSEARKYMVSRALDAGQLRPGSSYGDGSLGRLSDRGGRPDEVVEAEDRRAAAWRLLGRLDDRERTIVILRFGLEGEVLTLEEIGRRLGLTRERVRQLEVHALGKLRRRQAVDAADAADAR